MTVTQVDAVVGYLSLPEGEIDRLIRGLPVVLIDREHRVERFNAIRVEGEAGVHDAIRHLVETGHRRIGMLDHDARAELSIRHHWFATAMAACGLEPAAVGRPGQSIDGGEQALRRLIAEHPDVTAVFAFNEVIAVGALRAARRLGRRLPVDLAVVGFDGLQLGTLVDPALTTVALDTRELGVLAVEQVGRLPSGSGPLRRDEAAVVAELRLRESA